MPAEGALSSGIRQPASRFCFVCGKENTYGLQMDFFNDATKVWSTFTPQTHHQSWPGMVHGGILSAVLDETIARVAFLYDKWVQTGKLEVKFRKPAPLGEALYVEAELIRDAGRAMEMKGVIMLASTRDVIAEASGLFMRIPDSEKQRLMTTLGDEFSVWEAWFAQIRQIAPEPNQMDSEGENR
jgi:acyl-coenzyme A thioesterase PaaI-like protein